MGCNRVSEEGTQLFVAFGTDEQGKVLGPVSATWRTADPTIATVDANGIVTGVRVGTTRVLASAWGMEASMDVHVECPRAARVDITPTGDLTLEPGGTLQFSARAYGERGRELTCASIAWGADNANVATMRESGLLTAQGPGTVIVTAAVGGLLDPAWVRVTVPGEPPRAASFTHLAADATHTCGLDAAGGAHCWGWDSFGQLGRGTRGGEQERFPLQAPVLTDVRFVELALGSDHSCGREASGKAWCWGLGNVGQLGSMSTGGFTTPVPVLDGHLYTRLSAGGGHTCALDGEAAAWCWGSNVDGALGTGGSGGGGPHPARVAGGLRFTSLAAGLWSTCAVDVEGQAYCWGSNTFGQVGHGGTAGSLFVVRSPTAVQQGDVRFTMVDITSQHACALTASGEAWCWGWNLSGQLGDGSTTNRTAPVKVQTDVHFKSVSTAGFHSCGLDTNDEAWCWGLNGSGQLGDGTHVHSVTPVKVAGGRRFASLTSGTHHTCGVTLDDEAYCWGSGYYGGLGNGDFHQDSGSAVPVPVAPVQ